MFIYFVVLGVFVRGMNVSRTHSEILAANTAVAAVEEAMRRTQAQFANPNLILDIILIHIAEAPVPVLQGVVNDNLRYLQQVAQSPLVA
jgi:hypothetical protein